MNNLPIYHERFKRFPCVSPLMVLESAAGFYIGKVYYYSEDEFQPYSRSSTYYKTKESADRSLINNDYVQVDL